MDDRPIWQYAVMLAFGIGLAGLGVLWYREHWSSDEASRHDQKAAASLSAWGQRVGRSAHRAIIGILGLFLIALVALPAGGILTAAASEGSFAGLLGTWLLGIGVAAFIACWPVWLLVFLFGRPNFLLPPGLRGQPGFLWDSRPVIHSARITGAQPAGEDLFFAAFCSCGWMDVPHASEDLAREAALAHTPHVRNRIDEVR